MSKISSELLEEYIDGTIGHLEKIVLEEHLILCSECRKELNRLKILDWDMRHFFGIDVEIPPQLSVIRELAIHERLREERIEEDFSFKDMVNLQMTSFQNSFKFLGMLPGVSRKEAVLPPKKKKSLLRRIIGF